MIWNPFRRKQRLTTKKAQGMLDMIDMHQKHWLKNSFKDPGLAREQMDILEERKQRILSELFDG